MLYCMQITDAIDEFFCHGLFGNSFQEKLTENYKNKQKIAKKNINILNKQEKFPLKNNNIMQKNRIHCEVNMVQ